MAVGSAFFPIIPLLDGQGYIAGPTANWIGIYWVGPTILYTVTLGFALYRCVFQHPSRYTLCSPANRSMQSLKTKPLSPWKLMLRDGLNLYGAI